MSEYGKRIISASGARQVDNKLMVPQLVAIDNLANWNYFDSPVQDGWVYREYVPPTNWVGYTRPVISFTSLPPTSREVYVNRHSLIYLAGITIDHPILYTFALDYVTQSSATYGRRIWNATGTLLYDSGNPHLNIHQVFANMNPDVTWAGHKSNMVRNTYSSPLGSLPSNPAICGDAYAVNDLWGSKSGQGEAEGEIFYRFTGGNQLQSVLCQKSYSFDTGTTTPNSYDAVNKGVAQNMSLMVIDRYIYD